MDIVLEVTDHFLADRFYAWALPGREYVLDGYQGLRNGTKFTNSPWSYEPSTHLFYLEPTGAAYGSIWARDNIWRQTLTLFTLGW